METIGLIEDNECLRAVFAAYFRASTSFDIAFAVGDIRDAFQYHAIQPDILLLDVDLPSGSGIDAIPVLHRYFPKAKIVMLSNLKDANLTKQALRNGASGFLLKSNSVDYIHESLLNIGKGGLPFSPETISHLIKPPTGERETDLTKRELEIVKLVSDGLPNKQVADKLFISHFTVNQHIKHIFKKLSLNSKTELVAWYLSYDR